MEKRRPFVNICSLFLPLFLGDKSSNWKNEIKFNKFRLCLTFDIESHNITLQWSKILNKYLNNNPKCMPFARKMDWKMFHRFRWIFPPFWSSMLTAAAAIFFILNAYKTKWSPAVAVAITIRNEEQKEHSTRNAIANKKKIGNKRCDIKESIEMKHHSVWKWNKKQREIEADRVFGFNVSGGKFHGIKNVLSPSPNLAKSNINWGANRIWIPFDLTSMRLISTDKVNLSWFDPTLAFRYSRYVWQVSKAIWFEIQLLLSS